jgi:hypothetical protein
MTNIENKNLERKEKQEQDNEAQKLYKDRILKTMENRVMAAKEVAEEMGVDLTTSEYFSDFLNAFCRLEGNENKNGFYVGAKIKLARRLSDEKYVYYRKQDEDDLVSRGVLGPEYVVRCVRDHYKSVEEIKDLMT